ncbi:MAG: phosphatidylglycerophosphatase A [Thermotogae bacterium]|nr:phosphatidylglycerophosphatase A [Thermotogota bacterium]
MKILWKLLATGFFVGKIPLAPATFGSLWALLLVLLTGSWGLAYWIVLFILLFLSVPVANYVAKEKGESDPREVVIDEVLAQYLAFATLPISWKILLAGFLFFRAYDILKPPPARDLEDLPGGWGIVADDLVAAMYTLLTLKILSFLQILP